MKSTGKATKQTLGRVNSLLFILLLLLCTNIPLAYSATEITLDQVDGLVGGDTVYAEQPIRFTFRMTYTPGGGDCITGFSNGFRVYEKNGNSFWPISYDTLSVTPDWSVMCDGGLFLVPFGVDGTGEDTVGFAGFRISGPGICDPFDQQVWYVETGTSTVGDTLCIDSSFFPPGNIWLWSTTAGNMSPVWSGPYCFHVTDPPFGPSNDTTESRGRFMLLINPQFRSYFNGYPGYDSASGLLTSPNLLDPQTIIGHSDTLRDGDPEDAAGVPVGVPPVIIGDTSFVLVPVGFEGPPGTKEVHTEVKSLNMTGSGAAVRAGMSAPTRPVSPGEVEMLDGENFPAQSFFDIYVELEIPDVAIGWGKNITAANDHPDPLLVRADPIFTLPPIVMYVHDTSNVVPVRFTDSSTVPPYLWDVGDILGYILLAGHGVDITQDVFDSIYIEMPVGTCCLNRGNVDGETLSGNPVNVADLSFLVDYLFRSGPPPPCTEQADVDGMDEVNVADLTYLVDYLFRGGPPPPPC